MRRTVRRPSASLVISSIALFIALGGAGYAASLPSNSVGSSQLKTNAVVSTKINPGAVTSTAIRDQNVGLKDIADKAVGQRALADEAVNSAKIASNAVGLTDIASKAVGTRALADKAVNAAKLNVPYSTVVAYSSTIQSGQTGYRSARATCPSNHRVLGGGGGWVSATSTDPIQTTSYISGSRPYPPSATNGSQNAWEVYGNDSSTGARRLMVTAICMPKS